MAKSYNSVKDLVNKLNKNEKFAKEVIDEIDNHSISKFLSLIRCKKNLTQEKLAKIIKCTQSRISKIESSTNNQISMKELIDYCDALNMRLVIGFENKDITIVQGIKHHFFRIKILLERLTELVKEDTEIDKAISHFFGELLFNFMNTFENNAKKLKGIKITKSVKKSVVIDEPNELINEENKIKQLLNK